jgi:riboflavin kinase / FMN adenylyltransferase
MRLQVVKGWKDLPEALKGAAVAFGNFDGVHRGHQRVIADAADAARRLKCPLAAVTFEPHPSRMLTPDRPPFRLMTAGQQARALDDLGVDRLYELPFDAEMHAMSDETFARAVLAEGIAARHVAVGFDVTFGNNRSGDGPTMRAYGERFGFTVSIAEAVTDPTIGKISSTAIREALAAGEPNRAAAMLGRSFAVEGVVVECQKLGRTLGFPTANVALGAYVRPRFGVYATRTRLPDGRVVAGVASLGINPTVELPEPRLEVWLFDFDEDLYGQTIETALVAYLRDELKFADLQSLTTQVMIDADQARRLLTPAF